MIPSWRPQIPTSSISLCGIFMILVSLENVKKFALGGCTITSKTKINVFLNFFSLRLHTLGCSVRIFFQQTLILAFEANSALSHKNETKIVKITHSAMYIAAVKIILKSQENLF